MDLSCVYRVHYHITISYHVSGIINSISALAIVYLAIHVLVLYIKSASVCIDLKLHITTVHLDYQEITNQYYKISSVST